MKLLAALCACGCIGSVTPAQCAADSDCETAAVCVTGRCISGSREPDGGYCPALSPKWSEINSNLIQVGCGTRAVNCHSPDGAAQSSALPLAGDPYANLVNARSNGFTLVKPGDPDNSYFVLKLHLTAKVDPIYGSGMPPDFPGQTCASAQDAVRRWVLDGALRN